jgi:broad specificity phosphatase PhoE
MRRIGHWLRHAPVAAVYASPLTRAAHSATLLARAAGEVRLDERLCEMYFGDFEGLTYDEIAARFPSIYRRWMRCPTHVTCPGGEEFASMRQRVRTVLQRVRRHHPGQTIAIVSHAGVNRIALGTALGIRASHLFRLHQDHGCVNVVEYVDGAPVVRLVNARM